MRLLSCVKLLLLMDESWKPVNIYIYIHIKSIAKMGGLFYKTTRDFFLCLCQQYDTNITNKLTNTALKKTVTKINHDDIQPKPPQSNHPRLNTLSHVGPLAPGSRDGLVGCCLLWRGGRGLGNWDFFYFFEHEWPDKHRRDPQYRTQGVYVCVNIYMYI